MNAASCAKPVDDGELLGYWLGELDAAREAVLEEHLFDCARCSGALAKLVALGDAVRALIAQGGAVGVVPPEFVSALKAAGLRVTEYRPGPHGSVDCTITPEDDLVVARLDAPLEGVERLDMVIHEVEAGESLRLTDVGFRAASRAVVLLPKARELRRRGKMTQRVELIAVSSGGERVIADYTFNHSPTPG